MLRNKSLVVIGLMLLLNSCSIERAPRGSVPSRVTIRTEAYGGWIELKLNSPKDSVAGEFIAVGDDSLYVMNSGGLRKYAKQNIRSARIIFFNLDRSGYAAWTVAGSLLTIANGYFLVFTLPATLATGIITTSTERKRTNFVDYPVNNFDELRKYARFPQGMPGGVNADLLRPRPPKP